MDSDNVTHEPVEDAGGQFEGAAHLVDRDDDERFVRPARGPRGAALAVVQPATTDEVREVVRRAVNGRVRLIPQGANSGLVGASVPPADDPAIVLSLDRLAAPPVIDPSNATAIVDAGTRLSALNEAVARHGLHLPVDLGADPAIGGMIATNTGGSRVLRYGPMRSHVLGVELVTADHDAAVLGRLTGLRKDSRGLDPVHVAVGSGGTLGVVTRAVLALTPLPTTTETWWLALGDRNAGIGAAVAVFVALDRRRPGAIVAFEYVSSAALAHTLAFPGVPRGPFDDSLEHGGDEPPDAVLLEWIGESDPPIGEVLAPDLVVDAVRVPTADGWGLRHSVSEALRSQGVVLGHDVSVSRSALRAVRDAAASAVAAFAPGGELCEFGHVADGGLHLNVLFPHGIAAPPAELAAAVRARFDEIVAAHGGSYSAEHGLGPLNAERWLATTPAAEQRIVAAIKAVVDPHGILGHPGHPYNRLH